MRLHPDEEFLRGWNPGLACALADADQLAEHGSHGHRAMRARIFALAAGESAEPAERDMLASLAERERVALELTGPPQYRSAEVAAVLAALGRTEFAYLAQDAGIELAAGGDGSAAPDGLATLRAIMLGLAAVGDADMYDQVEQAPAPRRPEASGQTGSSRGQGRAPASAGVPRAKGVSKRRIAAQARARRRARAVQRFRRKGSR